MEKVILFSVDVVRIISIGLLSCSFINLTRMVSIEHRPFAVLHPEVAGKSLSQTIDKIAFDLCSDLEVIITVDDVLVVSRKDGVVVGSS